MDISPATCPFRSWFFYPASAPPKHEVLRSVNDARRHATPLFSPNIRTKSSNRLCRLRSFISVGAGAARWDRGLPESGQLLLLAPSHKAVTGTAGPPRNLPDALWKHLGLAVIRVSALGSRTGRLTFARRRSRMIGLTEAG